MVNTLSFSVSFCPIADWPAMKVRPPERMCDHGHRIGSASIFLGEKKHAASFRLK